MDQVEIFYFFYPQSSKNTNLYSLDQQREMKEEFHRFLQKGHKKMNQEKVTIVDL